MGIKTTMDNITVAKKNDNSFIVKGRITTETAYVLQESLTKRDRSNDSKLGLTLDFSDVAYISSAGLKVLLTERKIAKDTLISIINPSSVVRDVFEVTGFVSFFKIE